MPAASAALALDHNHDSREPENQASHAPSASTPAPAPTPKKRGRPRITPPEALSPLARWVVEDRGDNAKAVAAELGIDVNHLYRLMNGSSEPSPALARKIFKVSGGKLDANLLYLPEFHSKTKP